MNYEYVLKAVEKEILGHEDMRELVESEYVVYFDIGEKDGKYSELTKVSVTTVYGDIYEVYPKKSINDTEEIRDSAIRQIFEV